MSTDGRAILVVGRTGQLARALKERATALPLELICLGRPQADLERPESLRNVVRTHHPQLIINAGAYTAVDLAESEPDQARLINAEGAGALAAICAETDCPLVHISTDYVFDGEADVPYLEDHPIAPLGVYGASKAAGESLIRERCDRYLILRTSWVYHSEGVNFVNKMLQLGRERDELTIVNDQIGGPTYAPDLAAAVLKIANKVLQGGSDEFWGTYHLSNAGATTWFGFAQEIFIHAAAAGYPAPKLTAVTSDYFPTPARRPRFSVLDNSKVERVFGITMPSWQDGLARCMARLLNDAGTKRGLLS